MVQLLWLYHWTLCLGPWDCPTGVPPGNRGSLAQAASTGPQMCPLQAGQADPLLCPLGKQTLAL